MSPAQALELHNILAQEEELSPVEAANHFYQMSGLDNKVHSLKQADFVLHAILKLMLDSNEFTQAALFLWGDMLFNPKPRSVQLIWNGLAENNKLLLVGGGAQGKSMTPAAWAVLWWIQDPHYTSIKVVSVTASHAAANMMASIRSFHENAIIKIPGRAIEGMIDMDDGNKRSTIAMVNLPQGGDVKGRLRGFHTVPRSGGEIHPLFGTHSRVGVIIDEGEDVSFGLWEGLDNVLSEDEGEGNIKIVSGANPKNRESPFAQRCEFPGGWQHYNIDKDQDWTGPESLGSWKVIRLDPKLSENVATKSSVFKGFMSYEGYMNYYRKGANSPEYFTFARGSWPESMAEYRVTPQDFFNDCRGMLIFGSDVVPVATLDPAFSESGDNATLTTGRYGTAVGFHSVTGEYKELVPHKAIQVEQQFYVPKNNTMLMATDVMKFLRHLKVRPEWFAMDKTGNGLGLFDMLRMQYGDILGIQWGEKATERKILEEDSMNASERFQNITSEMAFAFADWLQAGYVKFAPMMDITKVMSQAVNRKYSFRGNFQMVQSKTDYKASTNAGSPDEYDSLIMLVHLVRMMESERAQMLTQALIRQDLKEGAKDITEYAPIEELGFVDTILDK